MNAIETGSEQEGHRPISCFPIESTIVDQFTHGFDQQDIRKEKYWKIKDGILKNDKRFHDLYIYPGFYNDESISGFMPGVVFGYGLFLEQMRSNGGGFPFITENTIINRRLELGMNVEKLLRDGNEIRDMYIGYKKLFLGDTNKPENVNQHLFTAWQRMSEYAYGEHFAKGIVEMRALVEMSLRDNLQYEYY